MNGVDTNALSAAKSVITCDLEGRIETFNDGAVRMFGWGADEVVGRKRVSLFSPGLVVLEHVNGWLKGAVANGRHETQTVFVRKDGTSFAADIRLTPTMRKGEHVGYCGVTVARPDVPVAEAMPHISRSTRLFAALVVTRAPFLTATLVPVLLAAAYVSRLAGPFPWGRFGLALAGALLLHLAANVLNDYFDWTSGTDQGNTEYFLPFSGGSRSVELGLATPRSLALLGTAALVAAGACGAALAVVSTWKLLLIGAVGAFSAVFYTAPPLRLAARKGLGELFVGLNFGPLVVAGVLCALTGRLDGEVVRASLWLGLPAGLLTAAILWINEFPDAPSDARAGKNHLVVVLGKRRARWGYVALLVAATLVLVAGVVTGALPKLALLGLVALPLGVKATRVLLAQFESRALVQANAATVQLQLAAGLLMALGVWLG